MKINTYLNLDIFLFDFFLLNNSVSYKNLLFGFT